MSKRIRIIEGTWNCSSCGTEGILARHKRCTTCNNPRELTDKESEFDFGGVDERSGKSLKEGVTDAKALELAAAGEDWFCAYCGAANRGDAPVCKQCSAQRTDDAGRMPVDDEPSPPPPPRKKTRRGGLMVVGGILLTLSCCGVFGLWATQTHDVDGRVTGTEWQRAVYQERFQPVTQEGWQDELVRTAPRMPVNGTGEVAGVENVRGCVSRQRGTRQVADGTERVCRTKTRRVACGTEEKCTRRKLNNGYMQEECKDVTKYCDERYEDCQNETRYRTEPVYAQRCSYDTHEWKEVGRREASGRDDAPRWPEVKGLGPHDRLRREEKYAVHIEYERKGLQQHTLAPGTEAEFLSWRKDQLVTVQVDNLNTVQAVLTE
jgi:hypothetical protein